MIPRHDSIDRRPHHLMCALAVLFCLATVAGCGPEPQANFGQAGSAAVNLKITMPPNVAAAPPATGLWAKIQRWVFGTDAWAASVDEITGLVVRVTGPGIASPIASPLVRVNEAVSGLVIPVTLEVPVGANRVFAVAAVDAVNRPIFQGQSEPVTLTTDQPATVAIQLTDTTIRILPNPLPDGTEDRPYTGRLQAERGTGLTWTVQAGELPPGVRLDVATGALLGTSTAVGLFTPTIRVTDALGLFDEAQITIRINPAPLPPKITTTTLSNGTVGAPYRATLVAVDGTGAPTWSRSTGALPAGLNLDSDTGVISGTPTTEGRATFTVRATDTTPLSDEQELRITINPAPVPPTITTTRLPEGTTQARYTAQLTKTGGTGDVTWRVVAGGLPDGLRLTAATGAFTGTPTKNGNFTFTIRATDTIPLSDEQVLTIMIKEAPKPPVITTESLSGGQVGAAYRATLTATSTNGTVTWRLIPAGAPAPGLQLVGATITGTPTMKNTFEFTVRVTDEAGLFDEKRLFIQINDRPNPPIITTTTLPVGTVNVAYRTQLTATGGTGEVTWSLVPAGDPAPGLRLDGATGAITGTPTKSGSFSVRVRATDTTPLSSEKVLTLTIQDPPIRPPDILTDSLPEGRVGDAYSAQLTATSPNGPLTWSASGLPTGLDLNGTTGAITGTPTAAGPFSVTVRATDPLNRFDEQALSLQIRENPPPVITTTSPLPGGRVGEVYRATLTATSRNQPIIWSARGLPDGLQVDRTSGVITGTPTIAATFGVTVRTTDARNLFTEKVLSLEIASAGSGTITGTVRDTDIEAGTRIPDATVAVNGFELSELTNGDGIFKLTGVPAGQQTLTVSKSGFTSATQTVTVRPGQDVNVGTITITQATGTISGSVLQRGGDSISGVIISPLEGATVTVNGLSRSTTTDSAGNFTIKQVPTGNQSLTVSKGTSYSSATVNDVVVKTDEITSVEGIILDQLIN